MHRPSAATILATLALAVAVVGAGPQAQAVVQKIVADDSKHLQGKTLAQVRANIDATKLGGLGTNYYLHGRGLVVGQHVTMGAPGGNSNVVVAPGMLSLEMSCAADGNSLRIFSRNLAAFPGLFALFYYDGTNEHSYVDGDTAPNGGGYLGLDVPESLGTVHFGFVHNNVSYVAVGEISAWATGSGCVADGQITVTKTAVPS